MILGGFVEKLNAVTKLFVILAVFQNPALNKACNQTHHRFTFVHSTNKIHSGQEIQGKYLITDAELVPSFFCEEFCFFEIVTIC
jgi:hypothetical protein